MPTKTVTGVEAAQSVRTGHMRYVLAGGLALAALAGIVFFGYFWG